MNTQLSKLAGKIWHVHVVVHKAGMPHICHISTNEVLGDAMMCYISTLHIQKQIIIGEQHCISKNKLVKPEHIGFVVQHRQCALLYLRPAWRSTVSHRHLSAKPQPLLCPCACGPCIPTPLRPWPTSLESGCSLTGVPSKLETTPSPPATLWRSACWQELDHPLHGL